MNFFCGILAPLNINGSILLLKEPKLNIFLISQVMARMLLFLQSPWQHMLTKKKLQTKIVQKSWRMQLQAYQVQ